VDKLMALLTGVTLGQPALAGPGQGAGADGTLAANLTGRTRTGSCPNRQAWADQ